MPPSSVSTTAPVCPQLNHGSTTQIIQLSLQALFPNPPSQEAFASRQTPPSKPDTATTLKNAAFPILDRNTGFELSFRAALLNEGHSSNDRAGFSVILLSSDLYGIELGFWSSQIWAQADTPLFQHAESANTSTTSSQNYQLHVLGSQYTLLQSGNTVLSGSLRNYSAFSGPGGPYGLNNFLFLGDNTSSASADLLLGPVSLQTNLSSVPEPASLLFLAVAAAFCSGRMLRRTTRRPAEIFPANSG